MNIERGADLYKAIENAIYAIFDAEIPIEDPMETTEIFVSYLNHELSMEEENE